MHPRLVLSAGNFFGAAYFSLLLLIIAPYLALFMPATAIGLVVSGGALLTLLIFPFMPALVRAFGPKKLAVVFAAIQAVLLSVLALAPSAVFAILLVGLVCAAAPLIPYLMDLLLEAATTEEGSTAEVRTLYLTAASVTYVLTPLLAGLLLDGTEAYWRVFLAASLSLTPFIALMLLEKLPESEPPALHTILSVCRCLWGDKDLRAAALGGIVLQFFFHLAPLYVPLYLHTALGFPWSDLGWVFAVMLLPFVFIEYPAGYIADHWLGDKELMIAGFIIMGVSFSLVGFITSATPILVIALLLFITRIGAALTEAMIEGHFFRRVSSRDASTISLFRMLRPLAALVTPLLASLLLITGDYITFFMVSGALIVAAGVFATIPLKDAR